MLDLVLLNLFQQILQQLGVVGWGWCQKKNGDPRRVIDLRPLNKASSREHHSVELGRFRYLVTPQGHLISMDSYTWKFDDVTRDVKNSTRCVDDSLLWGAEIGAHFFQVCGYLTLLGSHGIIQNMTKQNLK